MINLLNGEAALLFRQKAGRWHSDLESDNNGEAAEGFFRERTPDWESLGQNIQILPSPFFVLERINDFYYC